MAFRFGARRVASALAMRPAMTSRAVNTAAAGSTILAATRVAATSGAVRAALCVRGVKTLDFGGTKEMVIERSDYPRTKLQQIFGKDTMAVIGYGVQGRAQSQNMRDNGMNVIIGLREGGKSWKLAQEDGWVPGKTLFPIGEAASKGSVVMYLLSDAGQKASWNDLVPHLTKGKTLYFSHGFSVVFKDETNVVPPADIDVILCAPKGSGTTVRTLFLRGAGINSSFAVYQDVSGQARERAMALGVAIGSGYLYETTFKQEVLSDLTGERGVLMGAIQGLFLAQYEVLREKGHSPSEAFNETVEEATQSLYPLIGDKGMDWMYSNTSTTAQRGALDWYPKFYAATKPVFKELYDSVERGDETRRTLTFNGAPDHLERLTEELNVINNMEMWRAGKTVRQLRPENEAERSEAGEATA